MVLETTPAAIKQRGLGTTATTTAAAAAAAERIASTAGRSEGNKKPEAGKSREEGGEDNKKLEADVAVHGKSREEGGEAKITPPKRNTVEVIDDDHLIRNGVLMKKIRLDSTGRRYTWEKADAGEGAGS